MCCSTRWWGDGRSVVFSTLIYERTNLNFNITRRRRRRRLLCLCVFCCCAANGEVVFWFSRRIFSLFRDETDESLSENTAKLHCPLAREPCRNPNGGFSCLEIRKGNFNFHGIIPIFGTFAMVHGSADNWRGSLEINIGGELLCHCYFPVFLKVIFRPTRDTSSLLKYWTQNRVIIDWLTSEWL